MKIVIKTTDQMTKKEKTEWEYLESDDKLGAFHSSIYWNTMINYTEETPQFIFMIIEKNKVKLGFLFDQFDSNVSDHYNLDKILSGYNSYFDIECLYRIEHVHNPVNVLTNRASTCFDVRFDKELSFERKCKLFSYALEFFESQNIPFCFQYVPKNNRVVMHVLNKFGYIEVKQGFRYYIENIGLEEYLKLFKSARRKSIKKEINKLKSDDFEIKEIRNIKEIDFFVEFIKNNFEKHGFQNFDKEFAKKRIVSLYNTMNNNFNIHFLYKKNQLIGGIEFFIYKKVLYCYMIGFDYEKLEKKDFAYYILGYYHMIEYAKSLQAVQYIQYYDGMDKTKRERKLKKELLSCYVNSKYIDENSICNIEIINKKIEVEDREI